jgi:hypothetical protein
MSLNRWLKDVRRAVSRHYSDDQPRDDQGRWTSGGGSADKRPVRELRCNRPDFALLSDLGQACQRRDAISITTE